MAGMILPVQALEGRVVRLDPYGPQLRDELRAALDCDPEAWRLFSMSGQGEHFDRWWDTHAGGLQAGTWLPFAVRLLTDGRIVGSTSFLNIRSADRGVEIGATFYRPEARGGLVNPDCKLRLMQHAFDAGALRVELVTDARNQRSQAAIAKLGAVREGVLRQHKVTWTGHIRDTVVFSVTDHDWPRVREGLQARLDFAAVRS